MFQESKGLNSPSLVRKASINKSSGDTLKKVQTQVYPDYSTKTISSTFASNYNTLERNPSENKNNYATLERKYSNDILRRRDPIDDIFTTSALNSQPIKREFCEEYYKDEIKRYMPLKRSITEGALQEEKNGDFKVSSPYSDSESLSPPGAFRTKSPEFHES